MSLKRLFDKALIWRAPQRTFHEVQVWMPFSDPEEYSIAFGKVEAAIDLLVRYAPARAARVRRLNGILIFGTTTQTAQYLRDSNLCRLWENFVLNPDTTPERIVTSVVHEATHAWLFRIGFGYEEQIRPRIERICMRAELNVARRLPNGSSEVESLQNYELDEHALTDAGSYERTRANLRYLGVPAWLVNALIAYGKLIRRITSYSTRTSKLADERKR